MNAVGENFPPIALALDRMSSFTKCNRSWGSSFD